MSSILPPWTSSRLWGECWGLRQLRAAVCRALENSSLLVDVLWNYDWVKATAVVLHTYLQGPTLSPTIFFCLSSFLLGSLSRQSVSYAVQIVKPIEANSLFVILSNRNRIWCDFSALSEMWELFVELTEDRVDKSTTTETYSSVMRNSFREWGCTILAST